VSRKGPFPTSPARCLLIIGKEPVKTGNELKTFTGPTDRIIGVALSPDGKQALAASLDGTARVWDVETGNELSQVKGLFATAREDGTLIPGGNSPDWLSGCIVAFSPAGSRLLAADDEVLQLWDVKTGQRLRNWKSDNSTTTSLQFSGEP
jgi:WD40 repeat protein